MNIIVETIEKAAAEELLLRMESKDKDVYEHPNKPGVICVDMPEGGIREFRLEGEQALKLHELAASNAAEYAENAGAESADVDDLLNSL